MPGHASCLRIRESRRAGTFACRILGFTALSLVTVTEAHAFEHLMVIQEVFPGTPSDPNTQYVMLRMTSNRQHSVNGTFITVEDSSGQLLGRFGTMTHNVANGGPPFPMVCTYPNCPAILIGTAAAQSLLGFAFDQIVDGQAGQVPIPLDGGRICYVVGVNSVIDCVAYGTFSVANTTPPSGENACDLDLGAPAGALLAGFALRRTAFNCASKENFTDFSILFPSPVANSGANANTDADADGLIGVLDCDDADPGSWYAPVEIPLIDIDETGQVVISWASQAATSGPSTVYDVVSVSVQDLRSFGDYGLATCMAMGHTSTSIVDPGLPPEADGRLYRVRARNNCARGTYGDSDVIPDPRDLLDDPVNGPCQ